MMKSFLTVFKHEITKYKTSAGTYVFMILAVLASVLCSFYLGGLLNSNSATFTIFFSYLPWILLFFIPILVMGVWADEWRSNTAERLFTLPIKPITISIAKFFAAWFMLAILLVLTISIPLTIMYLGNPDLGPLFSGYLGAFLLGGVFIAISFLGSAISRSQTGGVSISLVTIFILLASGWGIFTSMLVGSVPAQALNALTQYSILEKYRYFVAGVIDINSIIFFVALILLFLAFSHIIVRKRLGIASLKPILPIFIIFIAINYAASFTHKKIDVTALKLHTLSDASKIIIDKMNEDLTIKIYYSNQNIAVPNYAKNIMTKFKDTLRSIKEINPARITIQEINPEKSIELEAKAIKANIKENPLGMGESYYMGATFSIGDRVSTIPFLDVTRAEHIEFDILSAIQSLYKTKRFRIGILTDLDLGDDNLRPRFMSELMANYTVDLLDRDEPNYDEDTDVIIVFLTPYLTKESVYALDQYMVKGGHVMLFMDPFLRTAPSKDYKIPDRNADNVKVDHPADLLRNWGVEYDYSSIVGDNTRAVPVEVNKKGVTTYPLWLFFSEKDINTSLPFVANLSEIFLIEAGGFEKKELQKGLEYQPVLTTTKNAQTIPRYLFDKENFKIAGSLLRGKPKAIDTAFMLTGKFNSIFDVPPKEVIQYYKDFSMDYSKLNIPPHVKKGEKTGALIAIADMDFLTDDYAIEYKVVNGKEIFKPINDNLAFVYNSIQYLLGDSDLLTLRGKSNKKYPFERIEKMLQDASNNYQLTEQKMVRELYMVNRKLTALKKRSDSEKQVNKDLAYEIEKYRIKEISLRKKLRKMRRDFRIDIERMSRIITLLNIFVIPTIIALYAIFFFYRRRRKAE